MLSVNVCFALIFISTLGLGNCWHQSIQRINLQINKYSFNINSVSKSIFLKKVSASVIALSFFTQTSTASFASELENLSSSDISNTKYTPTKVGDSEVDIDDRERVRRKLEMQVKSNSVPVTYSDSLMRERSKQSAMKKTPAERRKDLCESLGRGC
eukprot:gene11824-15824_t